MSNTQSKARSNVVDKSSRVKDLEYYCMGSTCSGCPEKSTCAVKTGNFELFKSMMALPDRYYK